MNISFGNLNIEDFEKKVDCKFNKTERNLLNEHRTDSANNIGIDKFHIFDKPFKIVCGKNFVEELVKILKNKDEKKTFKERLFITLS